MSKMSRLWSPSST
uniref:Uncharacterized protein n=1 Tax=Arundo donax TaxID=35708 RepID=A0A0A9ALG6_ARUDO